MKKAKILSAILSLTMGMTSLSYIISDVNAFDIPVIPGSFSVKSGDVEVVPGGSVDVVLWVSQIGTMTFISDDPNITVEPEYIQEPQLKNNDYNTITIRCAEGAAVGTANITVRHTNYLSGAAKEDTIEVNIVEQKAATAIGAASLALKSSSFYRSIKGESIVSDGRYDVTWDISGYTDYIDAADISLLLENYEPFELGENGNFSMAVEEVWLDGVKYEGDIAAAPVYHASNYGSHNGNVLSSEAVLKNGDTVGFSAAESVRVVFTLNGLASPVLENGAIRGDVNGDKRIDSVDASKVLAHYALVSTEQEDDLSTEQLAAADVDKDGEINANDASKILAYYSNVST